MGIARVEVKRYRCFRDDHFLDIGRLTLVYGPNSSGKSALVRVPSLLAASLGPRPGLRLSHPVFRGAAFQDLQWGGSLSDDDDPRLVLGVQLDQGARWRWTLEWFDALDEAVVQQIDLTIDGQTHSLVWHPERADEHSQTRTYLDGDRRLSLKMHGLVPSGAGLNVIWETAVAELTGQLAEVTWLSSVRTGPSRVGVPRGRPPLRSDGGGAEALAAGIPETLAQVSRWFERAAARQVVVHDSAPGIRGLKMRAVRTPSLDVPFPDVGEGFQQVFSVLVGLERLRLNGGMLVVEEPESHLHPALQRHLADRIVEVLHAQPAAQVVLETHSEVLLVAALLAAANGLSSDVRLHWVETDAAGASSVQAIELSDDGRPTSNQLRQAFETMGVMRRELIAARRSRAR